MSEQVLVKDETPEPSMVEPGEVQYLTDWQIEENKKCFDKVNGPLYFLGNYCYVNCGKIIKFELRPYTTELIWCGHNFPRNINMLARQLGKCLSDRTTIKIKNKTTGEIKDITIKEFLQKLDS